MYGTKVVVAGVEENLQFRKASRVVTVRNALNHCRKRWNKYQGGYMTIKELAIVADLEQEIWFFDDGDVGYRFKGVEVKHLGALLGEFGKGKTVEEAKKNYANAIVGTTLVTDAFKEIRREIRVPFTLRED
jgi:hypothetical protein